MNRRLEVIKYSLMQRSFGGVKKSWLYNAFGPTCEILAKRLIDGISEEDDFLRVKIKGCEETLFYNKRLSLHSLYQAIAEQLYDWHWHYYQIPQTKITSNDIVFDCGSAEGIFAFLNKRAAKHIYAFEPLPEYLEGLYKTFAGINNVSIIANALGDNCCEAYLKKAGIASSITLEKTETKVEIDTIDHFCMTHDIKVSYIKADLEGYEMNLLRGATETIKEYRPKIAITTYHKANHARDICEFLKNIIPSYHIYIKGIEERNGAPVMLHAW